MSAIPDAMSMTRAFGIAAELLALSILIQSAELLWVRRVLQEQGIWPWSVLRREWPDKFLIRNALGLFLSYPGIIFWLGLRILLAFGVLLFPTELPERSTWLIWSLGFFSVSTLLIAMRWRGSFNGGSDSMTLLVSTLLCIAALLPTDSWGFRAALLLIAVQTTASYFVAGLVKLKNPEWRNGRALPRFLSEPAYATPASLQLLLQRSPLLAQLASWLIILAECAFPAVWIHPAVCAVGLGMMLLFHLGNSWALGLNRFTFAWLAAYPVLYAAVCWTAAR